MKEGNGREFRRTVDNIYREQRRKDGEEIIEQKTK